MFPRIRIRHAAETRWDQGKAASTFRKAAQVAEQRSLRQRITQAAATETFWPDGLSKSIFFALFSFPFQQWSWATPKLQPRFSSVQEQTKCDSILREQPNPRVSGNLHCAAN